MGRALVTPCAGAHTDNMKKTHLIRIVAGALGDRQATTIWVTAKGTEAEALEAVRQRVPSTSAITIAEHPVSSETLLRLGLGDGHVWHL
jgi:hypothetical protein